MSVLVIFEILGLLFNTFTADYKYSLRKRSKFASSLNAIMFKTKDFFWIFCSISEMYIKLWTFWKKDDPHRLCLSKIRVSEKSGYLNV